MKKLLEGIVRFRRTEQDEYNKKFAGLTAGQSPETLFISCSDSRVVPNIFTATDPGDLFMVRNVGNLVPPCDHQGHSVSDVSELAAIEYALYNLNVKEIIVCGHAECGAMQAILSEKSEGLPPHIPKWLRHGQESLQRLKEGKVFDSSLAPHNQLSQINVLVQREHILSYPEVNKRVKAGELEVYAFWFDLGKADVYTYNNANQRFLLLDEEEALRLINSTER